VRFSQVKGPWAKLSNVSCQGYEIHHGQTKAHPAMVAQGHVAREVLAGLAWQNEAGNVLGCYLHGLFEDSSVLESLFGASASSLDAVFEGLADFLQTHVEGDVLSELVKRD